MEISANPYYILEQFQPNNTYFFWPDFSLLQKDLFFLILNTEVDMVRFKDFWRAMFGFGFPATCLELSKPVLSPSGIDKRHAEGLALLMGLFFEEDKWWLSFPFSLFSSKLELNKSKSLLFFTLGKSLGTELVLVSCFPFPSGLLRLWFLWKAPCCCWSGGDPVSVLFGWSGWLPVIVEDLSNNFLLLEFVQGWVSFPHSLNTLTNRLLSPLSGSSSSSYLLSMLDDPRAEMSTSTTSSSSSSKSSSSSSRTEFKKLVLASIFNEELQNSFFFALDVYASRKKISSFVTHLDSLTHKERMRG